MRRRAYHTAAYAPIARTGHTAERRVSTEVGAFSNCSPIEMTLLVDFIFHKRPPIRLLTGHETA